MDVGYIMAASEETAAESLRRGAHIPTSSRVMGLHSLPEKSGLCLSGAQVDPQIKYQQLRQQHDKLWRQFKATHAENERLIADKQTLSQMLAERDAELSQIQLELAQSNLLLMSNEQAATNDSMQPRKRKLAACASEDAVDKRPAHSPSNMEVYEAFFKATPGLGVAAFSFQDEDTAASFWHNMATLPVFKSIPGLDKKMAYKALCKLMLAMGYRSAENKQMFERRIKWRWSAQNSIMSCYTVQTRRRLEDRCKPVIEEVQNCFDQLQRTSVSSVSPAADETVVSFAHIDETNVKDCVSKFFVFAESNQVLIERRKMKELVFLACELEKYRKAGKIVNVQAFVPLQDPGNVVKQKLLATWART